MYEYKGSDAREEADHTDKKEKEILLIYKKFR
jgi:hypothetical protein